MSATPFTIERTFNAPAEKVWQAITDKEQMKQWYFDIEKFEPVVGFEFQFSGKGSKGEEYVHHCKITEVIKGQKLAYTWSYEGLEGISLVSFELFAEGNATRLKLTHAGLETFKTDSPDFAPESFAGGWTHIIGTALKEFIEKTS